MLLRISLAVIVTYFAGADDLCDTLEKDFEYICEYVYAN